MSNRPSSKQTPVISILEVELLPSSPSVPALGVSAPDRYYFNLTDGETVIRDGEGIEASSLQAAVVSALEAVEELRAQDSSHSDEWQGWRLEIVNASGQAVQSIALDISASH